MRMTFHTDYALRMLIYAALHPDGVCTVSEVADAYGLSRHHLLKVALTLRNLGIIETTRGRHGGIRLAMKPDRINVGALVRSTEQDFSLVECMPGGGSCRISPACKLRDMFAEALDAYLATLDKYTLADVVRNRGALRPLLGVGDRPA